MVSRAFFLLTAGRYLTPPAAPVTVSISPRSNVFVTCCSRSTSSLIVDLAEPNSSQKLLSVKILFGFPDSSFIIAVMRSFRRILSILHIS